MGLWDALHTVTSIHEDCLFHGWPNTTMTVILQELEANRIMRFDALGRPVSEAQRCMFERSFRSNFSLSSEQWSCIVDIADRYPLGDIQLARLAALPTPVHGARPNYVRRVFASDRVKCCGRTLRVRQVSATVYARDECFAAVNLVKSCRFGCGARYFFDRKVLRGTYGAEQCDWHVFESWSQGELPGFIASKSGHAIFCTKFLSDVAVDLLAMG